MSNDLNEHIDLTVISLQKTLEKLFGDEQFERTQHINFEPYRVCRRLFYLS